MGVISYVYDFQGNKIKKTVSGVETGYFYNAEDIIRETTGGITSNYLHGIGIDDPVMIDRAGAKSYYFSDGLGSIREMADQVGTVQNNYTYGAWGEPRAQNVTVPNSNGYTGREFAEEGLYFYRARHLDPGVGRFVSEDIEGFAAAYNFYRYVFNNPVIFADPTGLKSMGAAHVCCDGNGNFTVCWAQNVENKMLRSCIEEHETDHGEYIKNLKKDECGSNQCEGKPKGYNEFKMTRTQQKEMECRGYEVEYRCLRKNMMSSGDIATAMRRIQKLKREQKKQGFECDIKKWGK